MRMQIALIPLALTIAVARKDTVATGLFAQVSILHIVENITSISVATINISVCTLKRLMAFCSLGSILLLSMINHLVKQDVVKCSLGKDECVLDSVSVSWFARLHFQMKNEVDTSLLH